MTQANVSRPQAIKALKKNNGDIVNAIMVRFVCSETYLSGTDDVNNSAHFLSGSLDDHLHRRLLNKPHAHIVLFLSLSQLVGSALSSSFSLFLLRFFRSLKRIFSNFSSFAWQLSECKRLWLLLCLYSR